MERKEKIKLFVFGAILVFFDQLSKFICMKNGLNIINENIDTENNGYYIILSIIIIFAIIRYIKSENQFIGKSTKIVLTFGVSGAIGNMIDRILYKYIICFIKITSNINLNIAYIWIFIAWIGMAAILAKNSANFLKEKRKIDKNE